MKYKFISHTADIKFQAFGDTLEETFENSFEALKETVLEKIRIKNIKNIKIKIKGNDLKELLYNFLEEIIFLLDAKGFISGKIKNLRIDEKNLMLSAEIVGDLAGKYKISNHVKAITYNDMFIKQENNRFVIQVVLDV